MWEKHRAGAARARENGRRVYPCSSDSTKRFPRRARGEANASIQFDAARSKGPPNTLGLCCDRLPARPLRHLQQLLLCLDVASTLANVQQPTEQ